VADGGDGLPLARRGGGEQRPGGGEENGLPLALPHLAQEIAVEHGGRAAAAGGSGGFTAGRFVFIKSRP